MEVTIQVRQYITKLIQILLGKQDQGTLRGQIVRGTGGTFALKVASTGLVFVTSLVLARILGAKGYGTYAYAISWVSMLSVLAVMGLPTLLTREVSRYKAKKAWRYLRGILRWSNRIVLAVSLGLVFLAAIVIWFLRGSFEPETRIALWIGITILPFLSLTNLRQGSIRGLGHVVGAQLPLMLILPVLLLALVGILYFTFGLSAPLVVGIRAFSTGVAFFVGASLLKKHLPHSLEKVSPNYHVSIWLQSAFPLLFVGAGGIINQQISVVMVGNMVGPEATGIFDIARRGAMLLNFVLVAINMPLAPIVASLYAQGEKKLLQRVVTKSARAAFFGSLPIAFGLIFFGQWVLLLFGKDFSGGSTALAILSGGQLVNTGMGSVGLLLNMTGYEADTAKAFAMSAGTNVVFNVLLIPLWGIEGGALATTASLVIWNTILLMQVRKNMGLDPTVLGKKRIL